MDVTGLLRDVLGGHRLTEAEAVALFKIHDREVWEITAAADILREQKNGDAVTYVRNQNLNVTNICINTCGFCGFSRKLSDPDAFLYDEDAIRRKAAQARERGVTEICTVSGLHPAFTGQSYLDILSAIRSEAPEIHIHASNPMEVAYGARKSGWTTREMLERMKAAGLGSMCGTAAEILVDSVRERICPGKIDTATWERIIREAHTCGIRTTATIMYGSGEDIRDRVEHLAILRRIQEDTHMFTEFVPLSFVHMNTPLYLRNAATAGATGREDILLYAVARMYLDNIDHVQSSWVKLGKKMAQLCLLAGADDLGGTMYEESISKGAGATDTDYLDPGEMRRIAADLGRPLRQRTTLYALI
ncbi:MAG: 5-amino-6-(D-ribitylamino)uracil--L-tyrosine 4-hydroxyphenyl transferase CofH [Methanomicrobiales archaeon]|nr:5-amino-6-(D-ribitylamino)uracil--L-tyrosine 4-hydroxyphenyl transferase CofH [Methanomicrobiales archaeon]